MGSTRYIMSMGELTRKDNSLCFRKDNKNVYIPVENTKEIYCMSEVSINSKLLDFISRNNIIIHFFNYYEGYSGTFYPKEHYNSGKLLVKQVDAYHNSREIIAKAIVDGIANNIYEVLYHYYKHNKKEVKNTIDWIKKVMPKELERAQDIQQIMRIEGDMWQRFYGEFKYILLDDFIFSKRVKRPPDNPINALISFGNTLLYGKTITAIYNTHLDQRISFLHSKLKRKVSYKTAIKLDCYKLIKFILEGKEFKPFDLKEKI